MPQLAQGCLRFKMGCMGSILGSMSVLGNCHSGILIFYWCIIFLHNFHSLKLYIFIISQFSWVYMKNSQACHQSVVWATFTSGRENWRRMCFQTYSGGWPNSSPYPQSLSADTGHLDFSIGPFTIWCLTSSKPTRKESWEFCIYCRCSHI